MTKKELDILLSFYYTNKNNDINYDSRLPFELLLKDIHNIYTIINNYRNTFNLLVDILIQKEHEIVFSSIRKKIFNIQRYYNVYCNSVLKIEKKSERIYEIEKKCKTDNKEKFINNYDVFFKSCASRLYEISSDVNKFQKKELKEIIKIVNTIVEDCINSGIDKKDIKPYEDFNISIKENLLDKFYQRKPK